MDSAEAGAASMTAVAWREVAVVAEGAVVVVVKVVSGVVVAQIQGLTRLQERRRSEREVAEAVPWTA